MSNYKTKIGFARAHKRVTEDNLYLDPKTGELIPMPSMAKQEFVEQCDINNILKMYKVSGMLQHVRANAQTGVYTDLPDEIDFQQSMHTVMEAEKAFASLPSKIRARFDNDPAQFLEFMADPANKEEVYTLGLATRPTPTPEDPPQSPETAPTAK